MIGVSSSTYKHRLGRANESHIRNKSHIRVRIRLGIYFEYSWVNAAKMKLASGLNRIRCGVRVLFRVRVTGARVSVMFKAGIGFGVGGSSSTRFQGMGLRYK